MTIFLLIIFGFLAGILGGMGMGGGTVLIPLLTLFLSFEQTVAQGINLICFFFLALPALFIHFRNKMIETKLLWLIILSALAFSVLGAYIANLINGDFLRICFGIFLILLSIWQFIKIFTEKTN